MMVVPAPRAIRSLSLSESRPKTVRVESSTANIKPATANTPTITGREYLGCPGMRVLLLQSGGGGIVRPHRWSSIDSKRDNWLISVLLLILTKDVEQRAVPVHRNWRPDGRHAAPIVHIALGRGNSLDAPRRPGAQMAAHNQDPFAADGVSDSHTQEAGPIVSQVAFRAGNVVDGPSALNPRRHVEANQLLYAIGTIPGYGCTVRGIRSPTPSACDLVRFLRLEGAVSCNSDP